MTGNRSRRGRAIPASALVAVLAALLAGLAALASGCAGPPPERRAGAPPPHGDHFVTPAELGAALGGAGAVAADLGRELGGEERGLRAAVVPHHLVAGHLAAGLFAYLAVDPPGVIIIAGPDHFNRGPPVGTSRASWQTAGGLVEPHLETIDGLIEAGLAREVRAVLEGEHSVGALMPLIKLYLPRARVVPLTLRGDVTFEQAAALGRHLAVAFSAPSRGAGGPAERIVFVASVDFSHYLPKGEADARDALTLGALERGEWGALFAFGPHHLDSAASLAAAFAFAGYLDDPRFRMIAHINSATVLGRPGLQETTSYLLLTIP